MNEDSIVFWTGINHIVSAIAPGQPVMHLSTVFNEKGGCAGTIEVRNCTLKPATLAYHVVVSNETISLDEAYTYRNDSVVSYFGTPQSSRGGDDYYGGLHLALQEMFSSSVGISFATFMRTATKGVTALRYQRPLKITNSESLDCGYQWLDPTDDLVAAIREITFRMAFKASGTDVESQVMQAERQAIEVVYRSDYVFLGLSLILIWSSAVAVVPLMLKWWRLGRQMSLSPIEIARAFAARELVSGSGSNSSASELMKEVGSRELRYGEVDVVSGGGQDAVPTVTALAFAHPTVVREPRKGAAY